MPLPPVETALAVTTAKFVALPEKLLEGISMGVDHRAGTAVRALNIVISSWHPRSLPKHSLRTLTIWLGGWILAGAPVPSLLTVKKTDSPLRYGR